MTSRSRVWGLRLAAVILGLHVTSVICTIIQYHPYEAVYFNRLAGKNLNEVFKNFIVDDWGLSYRDALNAILAKDPRPTIFLAVEGMPGVTNSFLLPPKERQRLVYIKDLSRANYYIRPVRGLLAGEERLKEIYSLTVDGAKLSIVYRLHP